MNYKSMIIVCCCFAVASCTSVPSTSSNTTTPDQRQALKIFDYTGVSAKNDEISLNIVKSILPGDPDYFPKVQSWGEYVFEVRSFAVPIVLQSAQIVNKEGVQLSPATSSRQLKEVPKVAQEYATQAGVSTAATVGSMGLAYAGIPFIGPIVGLGLSLMGPMSMDAETEYEQQFRKRTRPDMRQLDKNGYMTASVFLPLVAEARSITIEYFAGAALKETRRIELVVARPQIDSQDNAQAVLPEKAQQVQPVPTKTVPLDAKEAQAILNSLGYAVGNPDGAIGKKTVDALRRFQQANGLPVSGRLDDATRAALVAKRDTKK